MKTTKKGFTLIELIVVIAIIGVLAAILVPAMLGYVKKSKIQAANADAKTYLTSINSALEELDEEGANVTAKGWCGTLTEDEPVTGDWDTIIKYAKAYSDSVDGKKVSIFIKDGMGVASVAKSGKYYGTYPSVLTNKNYDTKMTQKNCAGAQQVAMDAYNEGKDPADKISSEAA